MIDANVYSYLKTKATITAVVDQRIYNTILPAGTTFPAITFRATDHDIDNVFGGSTGFCRSDYYVDAWGDNMTAADNLAAIVRNALKDLTGSFGGITVQEIFFTMGPLPLFEDSVSAFRVTQMFSIWHGEV